MPSPFPGMDPYLEGELRTTVHSQFAAEIARQLAPKIAPRYIARTEKRFVAATPGDIDEITIYADIGHPYLKRTGQITPAKHADGRGPPVLATVIDEKEPHYWVEIRDVRRRKLVTAIEILSPFNKRGQGREEYLKKRTAILKSPAHFLEIDLLRRGRRLPMKKPLPLAEYFVFRSRAENRPLTDIWPVHLGEPLPTVPVPLLHGDADSSLDLQQALTSVYDILRYYRRPPDVSFTRKEAARAAAFRRSAK